MSEPPHQVPFDAWNLQLRPDGWDDLGPVLQSDGLGGWDGSLEPSSGITGDDSSLAPNASSDCSFSFNCITPAIAISNAFNNHNLGEFDYQAVPSFHSATSNLCSTFSASESPTQSTFRYSYINTADPYHGINDDPLLRDVNDGFPSNGSPFPMLNDYTNPVASIFGHDNASHLLHDYGSFVPTASVTGLAATLRSSFDSLDPRPFGQDATPWSLSAYDGLIPTASAAGSSTPIFNGHTLLSPAGDSRELALPMQKLQAEDTTVQKNQWSLHMAPLSTGGTLETEMPTKETSAASKELRSEYICTVCDVDQRSKLRLKNHAKYQRHATYECVYEGCIEKFCQPVDRTDHQLTVHMADHSRIQPISALTCDECKQAFESHTDLNRHAMEQRHASYVCKCGQTFSRVDVLRRHLDQYLPLKPQYPCLHCKRHRGDNAFKRKQHLTQHLRGYHHIVLEDKRTFADRFRILICPHPECPEYRGPEFQEISSTERGKQMPFTGQGDYTKHMRTVHDESPFPCDIADCPRVGGKGYFREKDFLKHRKDQHPNAAPYALGERSVLRQCRELGCNRNGKNGFKDSYGQYDHYRDIHGYDWEKCWTLVNSRNHT